MALPVAMAASPPFPLYRSHQYDILLSERCIAPGVHLVAIIPATAVLRHPKCDHLRHSETTPLPKPPSILYIHI
jgi:hypothetical protein